MNHVIYLYEIHSGEGIFVKKNLINLQLMVFVSMMNVEEKKDRKGTNSY